jgi:cell division protein FtsZ
MINIEPVRRPARRRIPFQRRIAGASPEIRKSFTEAYMTATIMSFGRRGAEILNKLLGDRREASFAVFADTDAEELELRPEGMRLHLGSEIPAEEVVRNDMSFSAKAALKAREEIERRIGESDAMILTAGLGGGTGAGAGKTAAMVCREKGIFTAAVVTRPFGVEGEKRVQRANSGLRQLEKEVAFIVPLFQDSLLSSAEKSTRVRELMDVADEYAVNALEGLGELLEGSVAGEFRSVFGSSSGRGVFGYGMAEGSEGLLDAVRIALESPFMTSVLLSRTEYAALSIRSKEPVEAGALEDAVSLLRERTHAKSNILIERTLDENAEALRACVFAKGDFGEPTTGGGQMFTPVYQG